MSLFIVYFDGMYLALSWVFVSIREAGMILRYDSSHIWYVSGIIASVRWETDPKVCFQTSFMEKGNGRHRVFR